MNSSTTRATKECTCDGEWKSKIKGTEEGHFKNLQVSGGTITGKFKPKGSSVLQEVSGTCNKLRMTLKREDDDFTYEYRGDIKDVGGGSGDDCDCEGKRTKTQKRKPADKEREGNESHGKKAFDDDDEWVAEKRT
jgi:hypothetical protein